MRMNNVKKLASLCFILFTLHTRAQITLAPPVNYGTAAGPNSIVSADFNSDGNADLATANISANNLSVLLGSGTGTFSAATNYATGNQCNSIVSGDFNGDGKIDLATANRGANNISVLLGNGVGTFSAAINYTTGVSPHAITSADYNGDGRMDIATANFFGGNISVLLASSGGTFPTAVNYSAGSQPRDIESADLNNDGLIDLVVVNNSGNNVSVLLGSGTGTFAAAVNYGSLSSPFAARLADLDNDGNRDIVAVNIGNNTTSILLGSGTGTFATNVNHLVGNAPTDVVSVDLDGDGKLDLATANNGAGPGVSNISILKGSGTGTFAAAVNYTAGVQPVSIASADFNNDGKKDLAVTLSVPAQVAIFLNTSCPGAILSSSQTNVLCNGGATGSATVVATGGAPFTYTWSPSGGNSSVATGLVAGTYVCSVTNSCNIVSTHTVTITQPSAISTSTSVTNILCFGNNTGSATITASGGTPGYTYLWSSAATTSVISGLNAGIRTVTVTDANGCIRTNTVSITQPASALATTTAITNVICNGQTNGSATVTASGGTPPYNYLWSTAQTTSVISNISAGVKTITVTDANSCITTNTVNINQPQAIIITVTPGSPTICAGNSSTLVASATGGTSGYNYSWVAGPTNSVNVVSPVTNTSYVVNVLDANNCAASQTVVLTVNSSPTLSVNSGNICSGTSFTMIPSGAVSYTFSSGSAVVSPTTTTSYTVNGSNAQGCIGSTVANVIVNTCSPAQALHFDGVNDIVYIGTGINTILSTTNKITAEAWVKPNSVTGPFKIIVGNYATPGIEMQFCLRQQNSDYTFFVGNGNLAGFTQVFAANTVTPGIWQHVAGTWDGSTIRIYINGVFTNSISATYPNFGVTANSVVIGSNIGPEPWSGEIDEVRIWNRTLCQGEISNNMNGEIPSNATGLLANYHFNQGFAGQANASVNTLIDATSNAFNGTLTNFTLNGSTSNWTLPGAVTSSVTPYTSPTVAISGNNSVCIGNSSILTASGNVTSYNWISGPTNSVNVVTPTVTTTYSVIGTNSGCTSNTAVITVTVNSLPSLSVTTSNSIICSLPIQQTATLTASGANTYIWNTSATGSVIAVSPSVTTNYTLTGTDSNGCTNTATITQNVANCTEIHELSSNFEFKIYPNPSNGNFNLICSTDIFIEITDALGKIILSEKIEKGNYILNMDAYPSGVYFLTTKQGMEPRNYKLIKQ